jgi:hypothetical protein
MVGPWWPKTATNEGIMAAVLWPAFPLETTLFLSTDCIKKPQQAMEQATISSVTSESAIISSVGPESTTDASAGEVPVEMATPGASETPARETSSEAYQVFSINPFHESITAKNPTTVAVVPTRLQRFQLTFERAVQCEFVWQPFPEPARKIQYPPGWIEVDYVCVSEPLPFGPILLTKV